MSDYFANHESELAIPEHPDLVVSEETQALIEEGISANTRRSYAGAWGRFERWCTAERRTALPCNPQTLAAYVTHLCGCGLAPGSIENAIAIIRSRHKHAGLKGHPDTVAARKALRGYSRRWADQGNRVRKAAPAVVDVVRAMVDTCDTSTLRGVRDRAVIVLGFALMGRRSELSGLNVGDLDFTSEGMEVYIKYSKTDQDAKGVEVSVPYGSHPDTCPVRAAQAWLKALADHGLVDGALFVGVDRHGRLGAARTGRTAGRLHPDSINRIIKRASSDKTTAHGLRAGGATATYQAGAGVSAIADHGRWKQGSPVLLGYIRTVDKWKDNPMNGVGL